MQNMGEGKQKEKHRNKGKREIHISLSKLLYQHGPSPTVSNNVASNAAGTMH